MAQGTTGVQGANAQFVYGFEQVAGVRTPGQKSAVLYGIRARSFNFTQKPASFERTANIDPRGQILKGRPGFWNLNLGLNPEMSVDDIARLRFHMQGYAAITQLAAGVQSWAIRDLISTDSPTTDPSFLSFEADRGDGWAQLGLQAALDSWDISVKGGKIVEHKLAGMYCRTTQMKDPVFAVTGGTYTGTLYIRQNRQDADAQDVANDLKIKAFVAGALDGATAKVSFTKGATAYGAAQYFVTAGVWMPVILADGSFAGDPLEPVEVMWSAGGTFTLNDAWTINAKRPKVTATYPSRNALLAVKAILTFGGATYDVENFDIAFKRPRKFRRATSSRYPLNILPDGTRTFAIKINRDYVDQDFFLKLLSASTATFDITINGDFIATVASVSYYEKYQLTSTNAQVVAAGADVPSDKQLPEAIDVVPYWDGSVVDMSETLVGTLATLS